MWSYGTVMPARRAKGARDFSLRSATPAGQRGKSCLASALLRQAVAFSHRPHKGQVVRTASEYLSLH